MVELSSILIFEPPNQGENLLEDATPYAWPTYNRTTLAMGGHWAASFTLGGGNDPVDDSILEYWFANYLGCKVQEVFNGVNTFTGIINSMKLSYRGDTHTISLSDMANSIAVAYKTPAGAQAVTSFYEDAESIAKYGTKQLLIRPKETMSATAATQMVQAKLAQLAWPRSWPGDMGNWKGSRGQVSIEIIGLVQTLNWQLYNSTSTTEDDADTAISNMLASYADFVIAGSLASNTTQISRDADYRPVWDRIKSIAEIDDSGLSDQWVAGVYHRNELEYFAVNEDEIGYYREIKNGQRIIRDDKNGIVADALVMPGKVAFTRDIMVANRGTSLRTDPRASMIEEVNYSKDGVRLRGSRLRGKADSVANVKMALQQMLTVQEKSINVLSGATKAGPQKSINVFGGISKVS